jgi:hypothetical protein
MPLANMHTRAVGERLQAEPASSSVHRRRRPISTTSSRVTSGLPLWSAIRAVSYPTRTALQGGFQRRVTDRAHDHGEILNNNTLGEGYGFLTDDYLR